MIISEGKSCEKCSKAEAIVVCDGCGELLCKECQNIEMWGYGCGHGDPKAFCNACYNDPEINPWRA